MSLRDTVIIRLSRKVIDVTVVVKLKAFRIAVLAEETDNPLLLLRGEQFLTTIVSVIGLLTAKVGLHLVSYRFLVLALHLAKNSVEAVCRLNLAYLLEILTAIVAQRSGKDRQASRHLLGYRFARQVPYTLVSLRTAVKEAEYPR